MSDFSFIKNNITGKWVIAAPRRSHRSNLDGNEQICPFCLGQERKEHELYRVGGKSGDSLWKIRVQENKFPFTAHHEIIIHSPDHHKNFDELPFSQVELIFRTYRERYEKNQKYGSVYIFHNRGRSAGESQPHPHSQLTVLPKDIVLKIPNLDLGIYNGKSYSVKSDLKLMNIFKKKPETAGTIEKLETEKFYIFCPQTSEWPDEVWIAPQNSGRSFSEITEVEISDLSFALCRIIQILDLRYGHEFPFNFYIFPGKNWYLRLIPRVKILGGFELGTGVMVNTQEPEKTFALLQEHFWEPDTDKISKNHQADYWKRV